MQNLTVGGVPVHPALVHFPVAAWTLATVSDGLLLATGLGVFWSIAFWSLAAGALLGLLAMGAGFVDFLLLGRDEHPGLPAVQRHMLLMSSAWGVFVLDLLLRGREPVTDISWWLPALTLTGFLILLIGGHQGARLVYHHRIGVRHHED